jgi:hypothetical protein
MRITVLTYCTGYPYDVYERFAGSLFDTGFSGTLCFVISPSDVPIVTELRRHYQKINFLVDSSRPRIHINCHRFFLYQYVFQNHTFDTDMIFLCDSRDVLFQRNIEDYPYTSDIEFYAFQEGVLLKNEPTCNIPWIRMLEGYINEPIYESIKEYPVICCGTTLATPSAMILYVNEMCSLLDRYHIRLNLDQGIHNYFIYMNKLPFRIKLLSNADHLVNTVACDAHLINESNQIITSDGEISYVVHQYDRFSKDLKERISTKYNFRI